MLKLVKLYQDDSMSCELLDVKLKDLQKSINLAIEVFHIESDVGSDLGAQMNVKSAPALALFTKHKDGTYTLIQTIDHTLTVNKMLKDITGIIHN